MVKVLNAYPPNYPALLKAFPYIKGRQGIIFSWGRDKLYAPKLNGSLPQWLFDHEAVHGKRQGDNIDQWWLDYIRDPAFRLAEEVLAHKQEWESYLRSNWSSRRHTTVYLNMMAERLSGPLYGNLLSYDEAYNAIAG